MESLKEVYLQVIEKLWKTKGSGPFQFPVDYKKLGLLDYPLVITKPMCLNAIKKKIQNNFYKDPHEFEADLMLIWQNCKKYNVENSNIYEMAVDLEETSKKLLREAFDNGDVEQADLLRKRLQLNRLKSNLNVSQVRAMITVIREENIEAMEFFSEKNFTVSLDKLRKDIVEKLLLMFSAQLN